MSEQKDLAALSAKFDEAMRGIEVLKGDLKLAAAAKPAPAAEPVVAKPKGGGDAAPPVPPPPGPAVSPPAANEGNPDELAALEAEADKLLDGKLAELGALDPSFTRAGLLQQGRLDWADDGLSPCLVIEGEKVPLNKENLYRVLPPAFLRSKGVQGSGMPPPSPHAKNEVGVLDLERAKTDNRYFAENKTAIVAALRGKQGGKR